MPGNSWPCTERLPERDKGVIEVSVLFSVAFAAQEVASSPAPAPQQATPNVFAQLLPLIFIIAIFYFLLIRPQQQRQRSQQELWKSLKKGDRVVTIGGIHGVVAQVNEDEVVLEVAKDVRIRFSKTAIAAKK